MTIQSRGLLGHFNSCCRLLIEMKITQEVNNRLTREFQWCAVEGHHHIKRYHALIGCDASMLDDLHKLPGVGNAVLRVAKHSHGQFA